MGENNKEKFLQASTSDIAGTGTKVLHLMRHGQTAMNVYLSHNPYGSPGFEDPLMWVQHTLTGPLYTDMCITRQLRLKGHPHVCSFDTSLTDVGVEQAQKAKGKANGLRPTPELLVVSPLSRALHTADLAFPPSTVDCPRIMHPLARERLYLSSDVGLPRSTPSACCCGDVSHPLCCATAVLPSCLAPRP